MIMMGWIEGQFHFPWSIIYIMFYTIIFWAHVHVNGYFQPANIWIEYTQKIFNKLKQM